MRKYVYTLKSNLLEKVIANYIDYVSNPLNKWRQHIDVLIQTKISLDPNERTATQTIYNKGEGIKPMPLKKRNNLQELREEIIYNLPKPRYETAKADIIAVVDIMFRSHLKADNDNGYFTISSQYLKKATNNYAYIIDTLFKMLIINVSTNYTEDGEYDRTLYLIRDENLFHLQATTTLSKTATKAYRE